MEETCPGRTAIRQRCLSGTHSDPEGQGDKDPKAPPRCLCHIKVNEVRIDFHLEARVPQHLGGSLETDSEDEKL